MTEPQDEPLSREEAALDESPDGGPAGPSVLSRAARAGFILGALTMVFAVTLWVGEYLGWKTDIPYVAIGVAGLIVYNLARLPAYVRLLWPKPEEPEEKFRRKAGRR